MQLFSNKFIQKSIYLFIENTMKKEIEGEWKFG